METNRQSRVPLSRTGGQLWFPEELILWFPEELNVCESTFQAGMGHENSDGCSLWSAGDHLSEGVDSSPPFACSDSQLVRLEIGAL